METLNPNKQTLHAGSQRVLSTSRDDSLRVWDAKQDLAQLSSFHHYNNTGRWVVPFRAVWGAASDALICGSMKRTVSAHKCVPYHCAGMTADSRTWLMFMIHMQEALVDCQCMVLCSSTSSESMCRPSGNQFCTIPPDVAYFVHCIINDET